MRIGTVLEFNTEERGTTFGVVSKLVSPNEVQAIDQSGDTYRIRRGQGHKLEDQDSEFCQNLRNQHGITVGPCQKEEFGYDVVRQSELQYAEKVRLTPKIKDSKPVRITGASPV